MCVSRDVIDLGDEKVEFKLLSGCFRKTAITAIYRVVQ